MPEQDAASARIRVLVACLFLLLYAARVVPSVWSVPFPNAYDELAHLSYAVQLARTPLSELDLASMPLLPPTLGAGFGPGRNYLNHPPGYYLALGALLPPDGWPTLGTVHLMRLVNAALSIAAVGLALAVGVLRRLELPCLLAFAAAVVLVPILQVTGSGISNDNLALLGGGLAVLGAQLMVAGRRRTGPGLLLAGVALGTLAKFTAALMLIVFAACFVLARWRSQGVGRTVGLLLAVGAVGLVAGLPYIWFTVRFGSPVPVTPAFAAVGAEAAARQLALNGWVPGWQLGFGAYALQFGRWMVANASPVLGIGGWAGVAILLSPCLMLLLAVPGFALNPPGWRNRDAVLGAGGLALLLTLLPHVLFSWQRYHVPFGAPPFDAVPRYYFPLALALLPAAACWSLSRLPRRVRDGAALVLLAATVLALPVLSACHDGSCQ